MCYLEIRVTKICLCHVIVIDSLLKEHLPLILEVRLGSRAALARDAYSLCTGVCRSHCAGLLMSPICVGWCSSRTRSCLHGASVLLGRDALRETGLGACILVASL